MTFTQTLQKYCGSTLFLVGVLLYAAGNVLAVFAIHGVVGIMPLLIFAPVIAGLLLIFFESKHEKEPKNTLRVLMFFKVCVKIILVIYFISAIGIIYLFAPLWGHYFAGLIVIFVFISIPVMILFAFSLRVLNSIRRNLKENRPVPWTEGKIKGIVPFCIFGVINAFMELMGMGMFGSITRAIALVFDPRSDFGMNFLVGFWFGKLISAAGTIILLVILCRLNRELP